MTFDPEGWLANVSPQVQQEFMHGMLRAMELGREAAASWGMIQAETAATDLLDPDGSIAWLQANAHHVREQIAVLERLAAHYDGLAELVARSTP